MNRHLAWAACVLVPLALSGCSSEGSAREELERQGFSNIELERADGQSFSFKAERDGAQCTGTIDVKKSPGSTNSSVSSSCSTGESDLDTGPKEKGGGEGEEKAELFDLEAMGADFEYTPPADLQGRPVAKVTLEEPSNIGAAAVAFLQATTAGDRTFLAKHATEVLRPDLHKEAFDNPILLTRTFGDLSLELYDTKVHPGGIEIGYFHVEHSEGATEEPIDFELTLKAGKYHGFDLVGPSVVKAFEAQREAEPDLQLVSIHAFNERAGLMPEVVLQGEEDVVIRFVFGGLEIQEGNIKVSFRAETTHPDGGEDKVEVKPTTLESPGSVNADVTLFKAEDGTHHIELAFVDEWNKESTKASFDVVVKHAP